MILFIVLAIISGIVVSRSHKSPIFPAAGAVLYFVFQVPAEELIPYGDSEY
jgi:hypothetical protein